MSRRAAIALALALLAVVILVLVYFSRGDNGRSGIEQRAYEIGYLDNVLPHSTCALWFAAELRADEIQAEQRDDYIDGCKDARAEFHSAS